MVGSYLIGKERIALGIMYIHLLLQCFVELAKMLSSAIYSNKNGILRCLMWPELENRLTDNPLLASVHFVSMGQLSVLMTRSF